MLKFLFETVLQSFKDKSQYQRPKLRVKIQAEMQEPTRMFEIDVPELVCIDVDTVPTTIKTTIIKNNNNSY